MHLNFNRVGGRYCKGLAKISKDFFAPLQTVSLPITIRDFKLIFLELGILKDFSKFGLE